MITALAAPSAVWERFHLQILIGTYTDGRSGGIYRAEFEPQRGAFGSAELLVRTENPSWLAYDRIHHRLFAVNERRGRGEVVWFDFDAQALRERQRADSMGGLPCHLGLSGGELAVANYEDGVVARWDVSGEEFVLRDVRRHHGHSVHPRQRGPHAHGVFPGLGGWLVTDLGTDTLFLHTDDGVRPWCEFPAGAGPRLLASSAGHLFVVGELDNHLYVVSEGGRIDARVSTLPATPAASHAAHVAVHPDGRVWVSNRGHDSLAVFDVSGTAPRAVAWWPCGGRHPRHFLITEDGRHVIVANRDSDDVVALAPSGEVRGRLAVPSPTCVVEAR